MTHWFFLLRPRRADSKKKQGAQLRALPAIFTLQKLFRRFREVTVLVEIENRLVRKRYFVAVGRRFHHDDS